MRLWFGEYLIDTGRRELWHGHEPVHLEPQVFDLLVVLIERRDRVVTKDELFEAVWEGRIVSDATLSSRINAARRAVGDSGETQRLIRTVHRHGFRFVGEVSEDAGAAPPAAAALEQEVRFYRAQDGPRLAVATVGEGPPLVKTANWLNHVEFDWESPLWSPFLRALAERHRLVRYDGRGNGLSDWEVDEISFEAFVRDLETVVEAHALERFSLLGISQGASVAVAYAVRHPERVDKIVLIGAYAQGRNKRGTAIDAEQGKALLTLMRSGWADEHSAFMQAFSSIYLPRGTTEQVRWYSELQRKSASSENAIRIRTVCDDIDVLPLLGQVRAPTLVLHSRHDNVAPYDQGRLIASVIPGARLVSLDSDNHLPLHGDPAFDRMVREVQAFLA